MVNELVERVRARLRAQADPERAARAAVFFPSRPPILGAPSGLALALGAELARALKTQGDLAAVKQVAGLLYASGVMEEGACANALLAAWWRAFGPDDWDTFDGWIGQFTCWGTTDSFCLKVLGPLVLRDGLPFERLRDWATRANVWQRRAALVAILPAARKRRYLAEAQALIAALQADREDVIRKAIAWLRKEMAKAQDH